MGDNSLTVRGKKWERKNSMWVLWSIFLLAGVGFIKIGRKAKEKKWIVTGIFYLLFLWGGLFLVDILDEKTMEIYSMVYLAVYVGSIVHSFIAKKSYLAKYDKILYEHETRLEKEKINRIRLEQERIQQKRNIEIEKKEKLKEYEYLKSDNDKMDKKIEEHTERVDMQKENIQENDENIENEKIQKEKINNIISIAKLIAVIVICILVLRGGCSYIAVYEYGDMAEMQCAKDLTNNVFIVTPTKRQVDIKAIEGKEGMVIVKIEIKDEELLKYSIYGDAKELYYGYEISASGNTYYYVFAKTKAEAKEKIGW